MDIFQATIALEPEGPGLHDITASVADWCHRQPATNGLLTVFLPHTSASLLIQENADPAVASDLERYMAALTPEGSHYQHAQEGPDDMPAHIRAALTQTQLTIPVMGGRMALGTWQGIFLFEHRRAPHQRQIAVSVVGE